LSILGGGLLAVLAGNRGAARTGQPKPPERVRAPEAAAPAGQEAAKLAIQKQARPFWPNGFRSAVRGGGLRHHVDGLPLDAVAGPPPLVRVAANG